MRSFLVTGTDTGVGKTVVSVGLCQALRKRGLKVGLMKPIASGCIEREGLLLSPDALFMRLALPDEPLEAINPVALKEPLAPLVAAQREGKEIALEKVKKAFSDLLQRYEGVIVEGIGGLMVPIKEDYFVKDLVQDLALPILVVSRPGLGAINHSLLTINYAREHGLEVLGFIINGYPPHGASLAEETNPRVIEKLARVPLLGILPFLQEVDVEGGRMNNLEEAVERHLDIERLMALLKEKEVTEEALAAMDKAHLWHPFTQMKDYLRQKPFIITKGKGCYLQDREGNSYMDGISSMWCNLHGHRKKELDFALRAQLSQVAHSTLLGFANIPSILLAKRLAEVAPQGLEKVFFSDNGATAVEVTLKMAFQYWRHKAKPTKTKFISFKNAYHGDTLGCVSVGGIDLFHETFKPLLFETYKAEAPYCYRCPWGKEYPSCHLQCAQDLEALIKEKHEEVAALIIEPLVQAAAGMFVSPPGFLKRVRQLCTQYGILMIADEVATGFGRTGQLFACHKEGVSPDFMALGKGLTAGYMPLAATLTTREVFDAFLAEPHEGKTFYHGHTYSGNQLGCAVALANLDLFEKEGILLSLPRKINLFSNLLGTFSDLECVGDVRQEGLIAGIELVKDRHTREPFPPSMRLGHKVCQEARKEGLLLRPLGDVIVLMPPLSITEEELSQLVDGTYRSIERAITELTGDR